MCACTSARATFRYLASSKQGDPHARVGGVGGSILQLPAKRSQQLPCRRSRGPPARDFERRRLRYGGVPHCHDLRGCRPPIRRRRPGPPEPPSLAERGAHGIRPSPYGLPGFELDDGLEHRPGYVGDQRSRRTHVGDSPPAVPYGKDPSASHSLAWNPSPVAANATNRRPPLSDRIANGAAEAGRPAV